MAWLRSVENFLRSLDSIGAANLFSGLGFSVIFLAVLRWMVDRRRWGHFKVAVHEWLELMIKAEGRHPKNLNPLEWEAECERMLADARFRPAEIAELLSLSVTVAKAIAANKLVL